MLATPASFSGVIVVFSFDWQGRVCNLFHVRNEHANLEYRLNEIIVPESISGFGATFDQRIANSIDLLTGTLAAQYAIALRGYQP